MIIRMTTNDGLKASKFFYSFVPIFLNGKGREMEDKKVERKKERKKEPFTMNISNKNFASL